MRFEKFERFVRLGFGGVENFQPLQKVGDFGLPMLVFSPIIKVRGVENFQTLQIV